MDLLRILTLVFLSLAATVASGTISTLRCTQFVDGLGPPLATYGERFYSINTIDKSVSERDTPKIVRYWTDSAVQFEQSTGSFPGEPVIYAFHVTRVERYTGRFYIWSEYRTKNGRQLEGPELRALAEQRGAWGAGPFGINPDKPWGGQCAVVGKQF